MSKPVPWATLENVNTFCDNLELGTTWEKLFAFEYLQFNCKKEFVFLSK